MLVVRSLLVGVATALIAAVLWIVTMFILPIAAPFIVSRLTGTGGMGAAVIDSNSVLAAAFGGFVVGVLWTTQRGMRRRGR